MEPTHHEHDVLIGIERAVLEAVTADESLKPRGIVVRFEITAAAVSGLSTTDRVALQNEILKLLRSRRLTMVPPYSGMSSVFAAGSAAARVRMTVSIEDVSQKTGGYGVLIRFEQNARSGSLVGPIRQKLDEKRQSARTAGYDRSRPLWLVLEVTEQTGTFSDSIAAAPTFVQDIDPFDKVVVTDSRTHSVVTA